MIINPLSRGEESLFSAPKDHGFTEKRKESLFTAIWVGAVCITLAVIYAVHLPVSLWDQFINFFTTLTLSPAAGLPLPAPSNPAAHIELYMAAFQFAIAVGVIEVVILALRILLHSPTKRKSETVENLVFWLGTSYLIITYLVNMTIPAEWFIFWAGVILVFGLALIARAFVLIAAKR